MLLQIYRYLYLISMSNETPGTCTDDAVLRDTNSTDTSGTASTATPPILCLDTTKATLSSEDTALDAALDAATTTITIGETSSFPVGSESNEVTARLAETAIAGSSSNEQTMTQLNNNNNTQRDDPTPSNTSGTADIAANDRPWDFSNRKVILQGVDKFHDVKSATKMIAKWLESNTTGSGTTGTSFVIDKVKKPPKSNWLVVTLQSEAMVNPFIEFINASSIRSRKGDTVFAKPQLSSNNNNSDEYSNSNHRDRRRHRHNDDGGDIDDEGGNESTTTAATHINKRQRRSPDDRKNDAAVARAAARRPITVNELMDRIIPLWQLTTPEQEQHKMKEMIKKCAMKIILEIKNKFRYVY
jgi:hypothetical protein